MNAAIQTKTPQTVDRPMEGRVPGVVWVPVVTLGLFTLGLLGFGVMGSYELIIGGLLAAIVAIGLPYRQRWAHAMALVASILSPVLMFFIGDLQDATIIAGLNLFIAVPLLMAFKWFWKRDQLPEWLA